MRAPVPHGEFGKELVLVAAGIAAFPKALGQRAAVLLAELAADTVRHAPVLDIVGKLVDADVAAAVAVLGKLEQVLLAAGSQKPAHAAGPLVNGQLAFEGLALGMPPFGQIGSSLIAADDVQFGPGLLQPAANGRQFVEHHRQTGPALEQGLVGHVPGRLDGNPFVVQPLGEEAFFRRIDDEDPFERRDLNILEFDALRAKNHLLHGKILMISNRRAGCGDLGINERAPEFIIALHHYADRERLIDADEILERTTEMREPISQIDLQFVDTLPAVSPQERNEELAFLRLGGLNVEGQHERLARRPGMSPFRAIVAARVSGFSVSGVISFIHFEPILPSGN